MESDSTNSVTCDTISGTNFTFIRFGFSGIPENLSINVSIWVVLFVTFLCLKYYTWRKSFRGCLHIYQINMIQLFLGDTNFIKTKGYPSSISQNYPIFEDCYSRMTCCRKFYRWLRNNVWANNELVFERCSYDAKLYLSFERHILLFFAINTAISLAIILPLNLLGHMELNPQHLFAKTTMVNVHPHSQLLWVHVIVSLATVFIWIKILKSFRSKLTAYKKDQLAERTVRFKNIVPEYADVEAFINYFKVHYEDCEIVKIKLFRNIKQLVNISRNLAWAVDAKRFSNYMHRTFQKDIIVKNCWFFHHLCGCACCGCMMSPGSLYYENLIRKFQKELYNEYWKTINDTPSIAFVTFANKSQAANILHQEQANEGVVQHWCVREAPAPSDIIWENLLESKGIHNFKYICINTGVFLFLFFLTTPTIIVSSTGILVFMKYLERMNPLVPSFLLPAILTILAISLPPLVSYSSWFLPFKKKSSLCRSIMKRTYFFLIVSVVLLPALGLPSLHSFMLKVLKKPDEKYQFECIFIPDNGAFFVNYVITSGFISSIVSFFRVADILWYLFFVMFVKSEAEKIALFKQTIYECPFGENYASLLLIVTVVMFYSIPIPIIAPFGLLYICLRYMVDRYLLCFAYAPSTLDAEVHQLPVNFVFIALVLKNFGLYGFLILRGGWSYLTVVMLIIAVFTLWIGVYYVKFKCCAKCCETEPEVSIEREPREATYFPDFLQKYLPFLEEDTDESIPGSIESSPSVQTE